MVSIMSEKNYVELNNVVQLKPDRGSNQPAQILLARLPAAMHSLRDKARQQLQGLLRDLFDKVDDAMFELADKASSNHEQNLYFDSMREVRLRRRTMEFAFFRSIDIRFAQLLDPSAYRDETHPEAKEISLEDLSLVKNDDLEEMVAVEGMINKANEQFAEAIQHLTLRIDHLVPIKIYQKNNPLGVDVICNAFNDAAKALQIDVKAKLVLFKLFDNMVMTKLGGLFQSLNQFLIEANILPSLKQDPKAKRPSIPTPQSQYGAGLSASMTNGQTPSAGRGRAAQAGSQAAYDEQTNQILSTLRNLLGSRGGVGSGAQHTAGEEIESQELVKILSAAQHQPSYVQVPFNGSGAPVNVRQILGELLVGQYKRPHAINQVDDDVINLVSLMFDFILDDRNLASPMKALVGRLQIPMVKVAIADKTFFSKGGHPARRLLNEMAMAALGWQEASEENQRSDSLYKKMESIVQIVLSDFDTDIEIFNHLLTEFRSFLEKDKRRAQILEQRTIDAEDGKAKSEQARLQVDSALNRLTAGHILPAPAQKLLRDAWGNVLFITLLKQGIESNEWQASLRTAQQLVWSLTAPMTKENRQGLLKLVPELLQKLREGLESVSYSPLETTQLFKQLEVLHLARLKAASKVDETPAPSTPIAKSLPVVDVEEVNDEPRKVQIILPEVTNALTPESSETLDSRIPKTTGPKARVPGAEVKSDYLPVVESEKIQKADSAIPASQATAVPASYEVETAEVEVTVPIVSEESLPETDPHLMLVSHLTQGSWFEMHSDDGQKFRCRLAAIIRGTGKYIFVNRSGMKVAEETRVSLANSLKSGRLHILDDGMLFDRALEAVIGNLRNAH